MPSSSGDLYLRPPPGRMLKRELLAISLLDSLTGEIRRLTVRRQDVYVRAQAHRQDGQLVPASLCEELVENASQLRRALDRYAQETAPPD